MNQSEVSTNYEDGLRRKSEIRNEQEEIQLERESQI